MAVSMEQLREMADRLPRTRREFCGSHYRVSCAPEINPVSYREHNIVSSWDMRCETVEFRHRDVLVDGVRCLAWYYHDLLVKVCV